METFVQLSVVGLSNGMIYALVAVGFVIIYKSSQVINFAQGDFLLLGAYLAATSLGHLGLPVLPAVLLTLALAVVAGLLAERLVIAPLIGQPVISMIMVTIGLSSLMRAGIHAVWGPRPMALPPLLPSVEIELGPASLGSDRLVAIALCGGILLAAGLFVKKSRTGIAMRAIADDPQAAMSMGISIRRILALAWSLAAACAAFSGLLVAQIMGVSHEISFLGLKVFPVVILGGLDSLMGAVVAGVIVGLLEAYSGGYIGFGLNLIVPFLLLILMLMLRPYGLFGKVEIERV